MRKPKIFLLIPVSLFFAALSVFAKGSPDKIIIRERGSDAIEITDRAILKRFSPWGGQFIDWSRGPIAAPRDQTRCSEVFFYMKWEGRKSPYDEGKLKMIYAVRYCPGENGAPGLIYLPGKDDRYRVNAATILRDGNDGKWHQASAAWDEVMKRIMTRNAQRTSLIGLMNEALIVCLGAASAWY